MLKKIKGYIKGKKSYSLALLVTFLMTGGFAYSEENIIIKKSEDTELMIFVNSLFSKLENKSIKNILDFKLNNENINPPVVPEPPVNPPLPPIVPEPPIDPPLPPVVPPLPPIINTGNIVLDSTGTLGNMSALTIETGKELVNNGDLNITSDIILNPDRSYNKIVSGAFVDGGKFINNGNITTNGALSKSLLKGEGFGIYQKSGETINNGRIFIQGTGHDIENDGEADIPGGVAIYAESGTVVNSDSGIIESNSNTPLQSGVGMATVSGATLINNGIIKNMFSSMWAINRNSLAVNNGMIETQRVGMTAGNGGTVINNGTIKAWVYSDNPSGLLEGPAYAMSSMSYDGEKTLAKNSETGVIYGLVSVTGRAAKFVNEGIVNGRVISDSGGVIENITGTITGVDEAPSEVIINDGGKFIQGINAKLDVDKFVGDLFLSGDYAKNNFEDRIILSEENINIKDHDGEVLSNSIMYDVNNSKTELSRKNFNEILDNSEFASYLENNYVDGNILRQELYNNLKLIDNEKEFTRSVNNIFGNDIYPNVKKQTLEMLRFNRSTLVNNIFNQSSDKELRVIGGIDYKHIEADSSNLSGYKEDISSVFLGADKQVKTNLRLGAVANIGTLNAKFDMDNAKREDTFGQLNIYSIYKNNNVQLVNNLFFGLSSGDIKRDLNFGDIYGHQKGDMDNKWIGLNNILSKEYFINSLFIKPRLELNTTYLMQDSISENGNYGLDIEKQNVWSVEAGAGIEVGKEFTFNSVKGTLKAFGSYLHELGNPYDSMDIKLKNISSDTVEVSKYDKDSYKDLGVKLELEKNGLTGYVEYKYLFDSEYLGTAGMTYKF
ncbi:autotransporter domain-containing protein [Cetobacterium sp. 2A]|uniref:autotransporter domain-containing protein n=1 Tax=Cetobacterium sp. 2A TaxID=2754723 RepID=UPI00163C5336|nr:autotransporter domain-containing protein [Cetobacterium sp. 2A]MBC2857005.1 autotransporter domain-containing protein [Cetobacterium sp. 2A]